MRLARTYKIVKTDQPPPKPEIKPVYIDKILELLKSNKKAFYAFEISSSVGIGDKATRDWLVRLRESGDVDTIFCRCKETRKYYYKEYDSIIQRTKDYKPENIQGTSAMIGFKALKGHPEGLTNTEMGIITGLDQRRSREVTHNLKRKGYITTTECGCRRKVEVLNLTEDAKPLVKKNGIIQ